MKFEEKWKKIKGFDKYLISNKGKVKSLYKNRVLIGGCNSNGYKTVSLTKDKKIYTLQVHRLIALHFIPNPKHKKTVNHIDGNKINNKLENLEWNTYSENRIHAIKTGLVTHLKNKRPERYKKIIQLKKDGSIIKRWNSVSEAANKNNILISSISNCLSKLSKVAGGYKWVYGE